MRKKAGSKRSSVTVGNQTLLGQIAYFIENLHLSYHEVVDVIPYRTLTFMLRDKLHEVFDGIIVRRGSGKDMAKRRGKNKSE